MNDFMSLEMLATFAGLVTAVTLIVQFSKSLVKNKFGDVYVRLYTFIVALILTFVFARAGQGIEGILLTIINAIIVSVASMGAYETIADPKAEKSKKDLNKKEMKKQAEYDKVNFVNEIQRKIHDKV